MTAKPNDRKRFDTFDHTAPGAYFVTICAHRRWSIFGRVAEVRMTLNALGRLVGELRHEIPRHFASVTLDASVVMPNHLHGVVAISDTGRATAWRRSVFSPTGLRQAQPERIGD